MNNEKKWWEVELNEIGKNCYWDFDTSDGGVERLIELVSRVESVNRLQAIEDCIDVAENESNPYHSRDNTAEYNGFNTAQKDISTALSALKK